MSNPIPSTCLIAAVPDEISAGARGVDLTTHRRTAGTFEPAPRS